ncbi:MAG: hypothetical protein VX764_02690 [Planctomycetota bacterium]|nr:hypothetical protein [Planctomycetota bacterium]
MGKIGWIWFLVFIVLPIIQKVMEAKKQQTVNETKKKFNERKSDRRRKLREQQVDEPGWIQADREPVAPVDLDQVELGGGWVTVAEPVPVSKSTQVKPPAPLPAATSKAEIESDPVEALREQLARWGVEMETPEPTEDPYLIDRDAHDGFHEHQPAGEIADQILSSSMGSAPMKTRKSYLTRKQTRWNLTRKQLQNRLIWSEILGPPISLRPPDSQ